MFVLRTSQPLREEAGREWGGGGENPPSFYLSPNEQFTWLVKEAVKPAKAGGKQRVGCTGVHFPQVELLSPALQDLRLFPGVSEPGCGVCVHGVPNPEGEDGEHT